ncbi:E3 Ubiquitin ligase [uncultured archaeon]|nr:E3 Ubiquitin ligase [uncultured archaeon]
MVSADIRCIGLLAFGFVIGLSSMYDGVKKYLLAQKIRDTPTSTVEAAAVGLVELKGKAMCDAPTYSPIAKQKCAYWKLRGQYYRSGKNGGWRDIYSAASTANFLIQDQTGSMLVDPVGAEIDIPQDKLYEGYISGKGIFGAAHTQMDQSVVDFVNALGPDDRQKFMNHKNEDVRIYEYYIAEGDDIYVLGSAEPRDGVASSVGYENLVVRKSNTDNTMFISDSGERKLLEKFGGQLYLKILFGFALSSACLFIVLAYLLGV